MFAAEPGLINTYYLSFVIAVQPTALILLADSELNPPKELLMQAHAAQ